MNNNINNNESESVVSRINQINTNNILRTIFDSFFNYLDVNIRENYLRINSNNRFAFITKFLSYSSACVKAKQAAVIVLDDRIISFGYNGPSSKAINCLDYKDKAQDTCGKDSTGSCLNGIHAEQNAIGFASKSGVSINGATMYITQSPCISCAKLISSTGIKEIIYLEEYRLDEGLKYLKGKIKCTKFNF